MDDIACLKVVGILTVNFLFSVTVSNYLTDEIGLVKSPVTSLKIFCSTYVLGYFILFFTSAQNLASVLPSHTQSKVMLNNVLNILGNGMFHFCQVWGTEGYGRVDIITDRAAMDLTNSQAVVVGDEFNRVKLCTSQIQPRSAPPPRATPGHLT
jgi:hypothetical protein